MQVRDKWAGVDMNTRTSLPDFDARNAYRAASAAWAAENGITRGSRLLVFEKSPSYHRGWGNSWTAAMDIAVDNHVVMVVKYIDNGAGYTLAPLDPDAYPELTRVGPLNYYYYFPYFVLTHVPHFEDLLTQNVDPLENPDFLAGLI